MLGKILKIKGGRSVGWSVGWLAGRLVGRLVGRFVGRLAVRIVGAVTRLPRNFEFVCSRRCCPFFDFAQSRLLDVRTSQS